MLYNITNYAQSLFVVVSPCIVFVQSTVSRFTLAIYSWLLSCMTSALHKFVSKQGMLRMRLAMAFVDQAEQDQSKQPEPCAALTGRVEGSGGWGPHNLSAQCPQN